MKKKKNIQQRKSFNQTQREKKQPTKKNVRHADI